jgi:hypothetical protein
VRTGLTELLGIEAPIVLAPMGGAVSPALTAAVSNAGGLGVIPLSHGTPDEVRGSVAEITALTDRPFGVNLILEWVQRERLAAALDAGAPASSAAVSRSRWSHSRIRLTPNGRSVKAVISATAPLISSGVLWLSGRVPRPPALETAAASTGVTAPPIGARTIGASMPSSSVRAVRTALVSHARHGSTSCKTSR